MDKKRPTWKQEAKCLGYTIKETTQAFAMAVALDVAVAAPFLAAGYYIASNADSTVSYTLKDGRSYQCKPDRTEKRIIPTWTCVQQ